ncbi:Glycerophosphoryl diester phosphodiesterase precursor [compost metagenome]|uniref:glycerophosphodiester phosphodiesterase n=1 Tax=Variovorax boronicumulans TaxID=436515 RepID=A0AAW8DSY1_9BURK|nr:glycerophosphodiester phosphodiesterase [Variovorax boronicumulans]MDP9876684.1 glycerophosphoryl diester phosphodiesterase [Variovorax boronicumulans]MDP9922439.1 glycerophosphoryl diester phosphodiesterase [Variovorax boronicumulans]
MRMSLQITLTAAAALSLAACGTTGPAANKLLTLDGNPPLVIAHRGASGYLPEQTLESYARAIELGADVIEMDLVSTKDGVLIARHDPNLAISTDVAKHARFASRKKTIQVDGETQTGWFSNDFTLAEIKTLGGISTDPERPQEFNGKFKVVTFQEIIDFAKAKSKETGRTIAIYPETKNPTYFRDLGMPMEDKVIAAINAAGWNSKTAPIYVQSFEPGSLKYMKSKGLNTRLIQLIDGDGIDMKTGAMTYAVPVDRPYEWTKAGDKRNFDVMVTPAGLAEIKTYADGIGPWKRYIVSVKGTVGADGKVVDVNKDGKINDADATSTAPTTLIADAHKAGLFVHPFTFRNESRRLASDYNKDGKNEYAVYYKLGVDGVFTDFTDTALAARAEYLKSIGR